MAKRSGVAMVTGAAGGMGSHCARLLAEDGWTDLLLCDLDEARLEGIAKSLKEKGANVELLSGEITDPSFYDRLGDTLGSREVGAAIHTAGVSPHMADARRLLAINLDATQKLVDTIRPHMADGGAAVLFASMAGHFPINPEADAAFERPLPAEGSAGLLDHAPTPEVAYPLSKRAVMAIVKREAKAFGDRGARIVSISPGLIDTAMTAQEQNAQTDQMMAMAALPRLGRPEELAAAAVFLCSPAASFITGTDLLVDGGAVAAMTNVPRP